MEREQALDIVRQQLQGPRYTHTLGVMETAVELADLYGANREHAELAAIFHDFAKLMRIEELKHILITANEDQRLLHFHPELWHGPAAAYLVREKYGIVQEEILNAIRFHTTGRAGMGLLEKVVFLADYIEPGRTFPGVDEARELAKKDLDEAVVKALSNTIIFLAGKKATIFPDTFEAYNDFIINKGGASD